MNESEKTSSGKKAAISLMFTRSKLETFAIFVELLITVGIVITITLTSLISVTTIQKIITTVCGSFVWGFGLYLTGYLLNIIKELDK